MTPDRRTPAWARIDDNPLVGRLVAYQRGLEREDHPTAPLMARLLRLAASLHDSARMYQVQADNHPDHATRAIDRASGVAYGMDNSAELLEECLADFADVYVEEVPDCPPPEGGDTP